MKKAVIAMGCVVLTLWLGLSAYNFLILRLPVSFATVVWLPIIQIYWMILAMIGKVMYQWPARIAAAVLFVSVTSAILIRRRKLYP